MMMNNQARYLLLLLFAAATAFAADRGTLVRVADMYVAPGSNSDRIAQVERGRDMVVLDHTNLDNHPWVKVFVTFVDGERRRDVTGWVTGQGLITAATPNGDEIIFGEAVDSERQAEQRGGRKGAAQDALRLYYRISDIFPNSALAGEALWRSADIRWQLEKADLLPRPSYRELDPDARTPIDDQLMKEVEKKFPHTKWSDLAAYETIDNHLCGDWKGLAKCPEKESEIYERYAHDHPQSPKAPEALYNAAWRQAVLVDIYKGSDDEKKTTNARKKATALAQQLISQYPQEGEWKARARDLMYKLDQNVPVFGNHAQ